MSSTPLRPSWLTDRSSSAAAACGSCQGRTAKPLDALLVHVLDSAVAEVSGQLEGLGQGHHRRPARVARRGGGVGGVHQAEVGRFREYRGPGVPIDRGVGGVFLDADELHCDLLFVQSGWMVDRMSGAD
jgi:hypothetical protein